MTLFWPKFVSTPRTFNTIELVYPCWSFINWGWEADVMASYWEKFPLSKRKFHFLNKGLFPSCGDGTPRWSSVSGRSARKRHKVVGRCIAVLFIWCSLHNIYLSHLETFVMILVACQSVIYLQAYRGVKVSFGFLCYFICKQYMKEKLSENGKN